MYKNVKFPCTPLTLASVIGLAVVGQTAVAQTETLLEEVTVTAQFREQRVQDTPLSVTAVSADMMEARNQLSIEDVAAQAPNVNLTAQGSAFGPSVLSYIRGVGQYDFNPAYEPGVGMYIDDIYYPTLTGANFDLLDLERVEVLRGPQGTLTGRNSIGGAIKLYSRRPSGGNGGFVEASYGSRHLMDIRAASDFSLTETLSGRISGVYKSQDGFVDRVDYGCANPGNAEGIVATRSPGNCTLGKLGDEGYAGLRSTLRYTPVETLDIMLTADYVSMDRSGGSDVLTVSDLNPNYLCGDRCNYVTYQNVAGTYPPGTVPYSDVPTTVFPTNVTFESTGWGLNVDWGLTESLQVQSISAYRTYNTTWSTDDDFTPDPAVAAAGYNDMDHRFFSQEFRLNGGINDNIQYTLGAYYSDQKTVYFTLQDIRYLPPIPPFNFGLFQFMGDDPVEADTSAAFATLIYSVTDNLNVTLGYRYTEESKTYTFVRRNWDGTPGAPLVGALDGLQAKYDGDEDDYRLSVDYRFSDDLMVYGSFSTGFKGGGVSARPFTATQATKGQFDPETIDAFEVGIKSSPLENSNLNVAVFRNDYKDKQMPIRDCSVLDGFPGAPCAAIRNAGDGVIQGVEVEFTALFGPLAVDAAYSYLDSEWDRIAPEVGDAYLESDPMYFFAPDQKFTLGLQYDFNLNNNGNIYTRVDATHTGEMFSDRVIGNEAYYLPSTNVVNARMAWRNAEGDLDVALQVSNLTDENIRYARFAAIYGFTSTAYETLGDPREWSITVKRSF